MCSPKTPRGEPQGRGRGGSHRAETQPQATEHLEPLTWEEARKGIPAQRDGGRTGLLTPDSGLSRASRTTREYKFDVLSHEFVVICYGSHRKPMQMGRQRQQQGAGQHRAGWGGWQGRAGREGVCECVTILREWLWAGGAGQSTLDRTEQDGSTGTLYAALHDAQESNLGRTVPHASPHSFPTTPVNSPRTEMPSFSPSLCILFISQQS